MNDGFQYMTLAQASRVLPGRPSVGSLHRWRLRGVRGVRLRTCLVGGRRWVTQSWLDEFIAATTAAAETPTPRPLQPNADEQIKRAYEELERNGFD